MNYNVNEIGNLIAVNYEAEQPTVSARDLHKALDIQSRFSRWFDTNKELFTEGEDFNKCTSSTVVNNGAVRQIEDYEITMLMAKHLAMMSRTEKGKEVRDYLINLERAWNSPEQVFARALKMADRTIDKLKTEKAALIEDNERMKPKEIFADAVTASKDSILIGDLAKILKQKGIDIGQNRLFQKLRNNGYLIQRRGPSWNMSTQKSMEMGLFEVEERTITNPDGTTKIRKTTKVTGKGQQYFINKLLAAS
jgi:anti-repressor protein